jgi:hypothetical protein
MAVMRDMVQNEIARLQQDYRNAMEYHSRTNDMYEMGRCEHIYRKKLHDIERNYKMDYEQMMGLQNAMMGPNLAQGQLANNVTASALQNVTIDARHVQGTVAKQARAEEGVLMFKGAPLPEKWLGAFYGMINRAAIGGQWKITFNSEFSSDTIMLWLSTDKYSGFDADKVAATYLETINQRRRG